MERQRAAQPLIPLGIFRHRNLVAGNLTIAAIGAVMTATVYFLSLYQQRILELSPLRTGLALVPLSIVLTAGALTSKRLLQKYGAPKLIITGSLTMAIGLAWLAAIHSHRQYVAHILGPTLVRGLGASIVICPASHWPRATSIPRKPDSPPGWSTHRLAGGRRHRPSRAHEYRRHHGHTLGS